jgi:hypothetical protein
MPDDDWDCQWEECDSKFRLESILFTHLISHISPPFSCKWKECTSKTTYKHRGHLKDHAVSHMSKDFVSVWCKDCKGAFRNRQSLFRHMRDSECGESYQEEDTPSPVSEQDPENRFPMENGLEEDQVTLVQTMLEDYLDILKNGVKGVSLDQIVKDESKGKSSYSLYTKDLHGMELCSQNNCAEFIMDIHTHTPLPKQLITGIKVGFQAVFMKL